MKLLLTIDFPPETGGIQKYLHERILHLYSNDDIVISGSSKNFIEKLPCKIFQCTWFSFINKKLNLIPVSFFLFFLLSRQKSCTAEAGNIYAAIPAFFMSFIFKKFRYSVICHGMELLQLQKHSIKSLFLKAVLQRAAQHLVVSKFTSELIIKAGITSNYCYAPPRIDLSHYKKYRNTLHEPKTLQILSVGRLVPHKGHSVLLDAVSMLPESIVYKLSIAGDGPLYNSLLEKCAGKSLTETVAIVKNPHPNELLQLYREADLFIFPSLNLPEGVEGFGIVLLEAMAFRIPIIASDTGGIPEVVTQECAVLVPEGDSHAILKSIRLLYEQPLLRKQLADKGFERVKSHFSWIK